MIKKIRGILCLLILCSMLVGCKPGQIEGLTLPNGEMMRLHSSDTECVIYDISNMTFTYLPGTEYEVVSDFVILNTNEYLEENEKHEYIKCSSRESVMAVETVAGESKVYWLCPVKEKDNSGSYWIYTVLSIPAKDLTDWHIFIEHGEYFSLLSANIDAEIK